MLDERPTAAELIAAVADFLEKKAAPQLDAHTAFHAKVAVNALRIVERELQQGDAFTATEAARLQELLAASGNAATTADAGLNSLNAALCDAIREEKIATDDPALRRHLLQSVLARMQIDSPKYPSLNALNP